MTKIMTGKYSSFLFWLRKMTHYGHLWEETETRLIPAERNHVGMIAVEKDMLLIL